MIQGMWRVLIWPFVGLACGLSALSWIVRYPFADLMDERDRARIQACFGILDKKLDPHWDRWQRRWWSPHDLINLGSEWTRLDPQRAFKATCLTNMIAWGVSWFLLTLF
jgi:hypothetical protein